MRTSRNIIPILIIALLILVLGVLAWYTTAARQQKGFYDQMASTSTNSRQGASNDDLEMIKNDFSKTVLDNSEIDADLRALELTAQAARSVKKK
jgi:hypothetical protein